MTVARTIPNIQTTDLATYTLTVDGEEIDESVPITGVTIIKEINKIPLAKIKIADGDAAKENFEISNTEQFIPGKEVEIKLGYHNEEETVFKGIIIQHNNKISNGKGELVIECKDKAVKMTISRKNKHYNDVSDADIAEELIGNYGLEADVEPYLVQYKDLVQYEQSDWDFMLSRIDTLGKICIVNDGKISIKKPELSGEPVLDVLFGSTIQEYHADMDARNQITTLVGKTWNYSEQAITESGAEEPIIETEPGNITNTELSGVLATEDYTLLYSGKLMQEELQAWSDAKMMKHRFAKITGSVKFQGYAALQLDSYVKLNGVGDRFNGPVFVSGIKHEYSDGNFSTEATFGLKPQWYTETIFPNHPDAQYGRVPVSSGLLVGIVTDLEDPEGEDRVKIRIPVISESQDGIWARVATTDAGNKRGTFFRPDIGDEVLIGFIQNDASHPVILGMLNSSAKPAPLSASNDNIEKGYVSREQLKMIFNDEEKSLKIETPAGKKITISEQDALIKIEDENGNKITMDSSGITVEAAATLTLKAGAAVKIEAPAITVEASATTVIKGGMVQIN